MDHDRLVGSALCILRALEVFFWRDDISGIEYLGLDICYWMRRERTGTGEGNGKVEVGG